MTSTTSTMASTTSSSSSGGGSTTTTDNDSTEQQQRNNNDVSPPTASGGEEEEVIVMVTGGTGLVGSAIEDYIEEEQGSKAGADAKEKKKERWVFLSSKDGDLRNRQECRMLFQKYRPTHVIHLAAKVGGLFANMNHKVEFFRENILINDNIYECCRIYGVRKLVSMLSTCIFPDKTTYPITETMLHDGPPHPSNEGYAYAKRLMDTMNRAYAEQYKCNYTSIIPTNVYGPNDNFSISAGHVIPGLIHKCYLAKKNNEPFVVWGSGRPLRQFIYSRDLAELTVWVLRSYENDPSPITLSVDESDEVSIERVARCVAKAMQFDGEVIFDTSKADGQYKKTASNSKLRKQRPDYQFTSIDKGIEETVNWFVNNYSVARK